MLVSFLYIEPYEVRHEMLPRVKDLDEWMELGLRSDEYISRNRFFKKSGWDAAIVE